MVGMRTLSCFFLLLEDFPLVRIGYVYTNVNRCRRREPEIIPCMMSLSLVESRAIIVAFTGALVPTILP